MTDKNTITTDITGRSAITLLSPQRPNTTTQPNLTTNPNATVSPFRRWRNIGGNTLQRLLNAPSDTHWQPSPQLPVETSPQGEFSVLLHSPLLPMIYDYCQCPGITTILRVKRKPDIHITTNDLRDIIQHNTPIYHESLILCLEIICTAYQGTYVDPSFIPTLKTQGWQGVSNRFKPAHLSKIDQPHLNHPNIAIPVHINGNHWTALCRRIIDGVVHFI